MIKDFKNKSLEKFYVKGRVGKINPQHRARVRQILDILYGSDSLIEVNLPGLDLHKVQGKPTRHGITVTGNWRITFQFKNGEFQRVDLEDYH